MNKGYVREGLLSVILNASQNHLTLSETFKAVDYITRILCPDINPEIG